MHVGKNFLADAFSDTGYSLGLSVWDKSLPFSAANAFNIDQLGVGCIKGFSL